LRRLERSHPSPPHEGPTLLAVARHRGTDSSNPFPSTSESTANLTFSIRARARQTCDLR
jgi:hypothetical protein